LNAYFYELVQRHVLGVTSAQLSIALKPSLLAIQCYSHSKLDQILTK